MSMTLEQIEARVKELSELKTGWMNGEGESLRKLKDKIPFVARGILAMSTKLLEKYNNLEGPYIYPTLEGNLQIEYGDNNMSVEVTYNISTDNIEVDVYKYKESNP